MHQMEQIDRLARDTLRLSRNTLLVNLRFMDRALSMLGMVCCPGGIVPDTGFPLGGGLAVTGRVIFYDPVWVLMRYRGEKEAIVRDYLHMVFHCVFHHAFVNTLIDQPRWDLACDIAAESAIEDLHLTSVAARRRQAQQNLISRLKRDVKVLSAEKIYAWLREQHCTDEQIADMRKPFLADSHDIWYDPKEMSSATTGIRTIRTTSRTARPPAAGTAMTTATATISRSPPPAAAGQAISGSSGRTWPSGCRPIWRRSRRIRAWTAAA